MIFANKIINVLKRLAAVYLTTYITLHTWRHIGVVPTFCRPVTNNLMAEMLSVYIIRDIRKFGTAEDHATD